MAPTTESVGRWNGKMRAPAVSAGQTTDRVGNRRPPVHTPARGLYTCGCGAGARGVGTELAAASGQEAADRVVQDREMRYDRSSIRLARHRIGAARHRANALEVLDTLLDPALRPLVMPFVDPGLSADDHLAASPHLRPDATELEGQLESYCRHPNPYVITLMLHAMSRDRRLERQPLVELNLDHPAAMVREAARALLQEKPGETTMPTTIEKVLLLQAAPLFSGVPGEELVPLSRVAEEVSFAPGETIFNTGDHGFDLFIVVAGRVLIRRGGEQMAMLGQGETFGEMAVLDESPRSASAIAEETTVLLRIGRARAFEFPRGSPQDLCWIVNQDADPRRLGNIYQ